jgi:hypothetical protein
LENELDVLVIRRTWQFSDESGISTHWFCPPIHRINRLAKYLNQIFNALH